jgi:hypothetical protein
MCEGGGCDQISLLRSIDVFASMLAVVAIALVGYGCDRGT